jgi:outer membrane protein OmpA-like peptidoglycan-associated protein
MKKLLLFPVSLLSFGAFAQMPYVKKTDTLITTVEQMSLTVNSNHDDFSPVLSPNGKMLYFTSKRPLTDKQKIKNVEGSENVYLSTYKVESGSWSIAEALPEPLNGTKINSVVSISKDGNTLMLCREKKSGNMDLYESTRKGDAWSEPKPLGDLINSDANETSACFSPDGRVMYFISDRKGGRGKKDIWQATRYENGNWSAPKNLGAVVNTPDDEEGVFISADGLTLYFSSKGHNSTGGYDIYKSVYVNDAWSEPINLGEPINSSGDDLFYTVSKDGNKAFYSSSRSGDIDVYQVIYQYKKKNEPTTYTLMGIVKDPKSDVPVEAKIEIYDADNNKLIATVQSNEETGRYSQVLQVGKNYGISVNTKYYIFYSDYISAEDSIKYGEMVRDIHLQKLERGSKIILRNLSFEDGKATLKKESSAELNRVFQLLAKNPKLTIEIGGYSDSQSTNPQIWELRAKEVMDYLVTEGIPRERIQARGYGKSNPIYTDQQIAEMKSKKEKDAAHAKNRRVEIKVVNL